MLKYAFKKIVTIPTGNASNWGLENLFSMLGECGFYDNYARMFDQVRMNGCRIKIG